MLVIECSLFEIAGAAERNGTGVTEQFPLPLRSLYRGHGICADDRFRSNKVTVDEIKSYCYEMSDFGHQCPVRLHSLPF
jgi:hypothetical protein